MYVRPLSAKAPQAPHQTHSQILDDIEEKINLVCFICSHTFNSTNRKPKIICRRQHTYCAECVALIHRTRPFKCPECRFKVYEENIFVNRAILAVCEHFPTLRQQIDAKIEENEQLKSQNAELREEILRLRDKLFRATSEAKDKKNNTLTKQQQFKQEIKEPLVNKEDRRRAATLSKPYVGRPNNPEHSPPKVRRTQTKQKRTAQLRSQESGQDGTLPLQVFSPMVRLFGRKQQG